MTQEKNEGKTIITRPSYNGLTILRFASHGTWMLRYEAPL